MDSTVAGENQAWVESWFLFHPPETGGKSAKNSGIMAKRRVKRRFKKKQSYRCVNDWLYAGQPLADLLAIIITVSLWLTCWPL